MPSIAERLPEIMTWLAWGGALLTALVSTLVLLREGARTDQLQSGTSFVIAGLLPWIAGGAPVGAAAALAFALHGFLAIWNARWIRKLATTPGHWLGSPGEATSVWSRALRSLYLAAGLALIGLLRIEGSPLQDPATRTVWKVALAIWLAGASLTWLRMPLARRLPSSERLDSSRSLMCRGALILAGATCLARMVAAWLGSGSVWTGTTGETLLLLLVLQLTLTVSLQERETAGRGQLAALGLAAGGLAALGAVITAWSQGYGG